MSTKRAKAVMKGSPFKDPNGRMPLWLEIEAELGYWMYEMKLIYKRMPKSTIAKMIDDSIGYSQGLEKEALHAAKRIIELKEALSEVRGEKISTESEKEIVSCLTK